MHRSLRSLRIAELPDRPGSSTGAGLAAAAETGKHCSDPTFLLNRYAAMRARVELRTGGIGGSASGVQYGARWVCGALD